METPKKTLFEISESLSENYSLLHDWRSYLSELYYQVEESDAEKANNAATNYSNMIDSLTDAINGASYAEQDTYRAAVLEAKLPF